MSRKASIVNVSSGAGVSREEVRACCRETGSGQLQCPKTESKSEYWGRDKEMWSGSEGRSNNRRSVQKRVLEARV